MVTAVVLTKNEEKNIVDCLEGLRFCDEILVVDDNSEDRTEEIAKRFNVKIIKHSLNDDFSKQRNFALENVSSGWVLFVDADERINEVLAKEISYATLDDKNEGYLLKRDDIIWGKRLKYGETGGMKFLRLAKKGLGQWEGKVHEEWRIKGKIGTLSNHIDHYPHQTVGEFLKEINYYTDLRAQELYSKGVSVRWYGILFYPKAKFLLNYFLRLGILDGLPGFVFAIMMSFHSFLVRGKLWQLNQKKN